LRTQGDGGQTQKHRVWSANSAQRSILAPKKRLFRAVYRNFDKLGSSIEVLYKLTLTLLH